MFSLADVMVAAGHINTLACQSSKRLLRVPLFTQGKQRPHLELFALDGNPRLCCKDVLGGCGVVLVRDALRGVPVLRTQRAGSIKKRSVQFIYQQLPEVVK